MANLRTEVTRLKLAGQILPQATTVLPDHALMRIGLQAGGLMLCDGPGIRLAHRLRAAGFREALGLDLLDVPWKSDDPDMYRRAWELAQGVPGPSTIITPSVRIRPGDLAALDAQIERGQELVGLYGKDPSVDRVIGLGLDHRWLRPEHVEVLHDRVGSIGQTVAVAFACVYDPLGSKDAAAGLKHLLRAGDVVLLRADLAAAGAFAHDAPFTAIGLTSSVRHLPVPIARSPDAPPRGPVAVHVLVPASLGWIEAARLWHAGRHLELYCACDAHPSGRWLGELRDAALKQEAVVHAFHTWHQLAERLYATSTADRRFEWGRMCREAVEERERLEALTGVSFSRQPLQAWTAL